MVLPHLEAGRSDGRLPDSGGSDKLPEEGEDEKLPEGGGDKQPEETLAGKLVSPCKKGIFLLLLI